MADPNFVHASAQAIQLVGALPALPGGKKLDSPPDGLPAPPTALPGIDGEAKVNTISRIGYFSSTANPTEVAQYLRTHVPNGLTLPKPGAIRPATPTTSSGVVGSPVVYVGGGGTGFSASELIVQIVGSGSGSNVQAVALVTWAGSRPGGSTTGPLQNTSSVDITITRQTAATVQKSIRGDAATHLAALVAGLSARTPITVNCLVDSGKHDVLTFHTASTTVTVNVRLDPCGQILVRYGNSTATSYPDPSGFDRSVLSAVGLPANYGS